ncbi:hypothetical protein F4553_004352 [Allocatelliglobosispora scoriae]|uniref:DUF2029 domain-containing protein n=1 Tax=Allocatelliglobosispora scoriae TaxID=643052 RepID=A0A841BVM7_9ACTN|nr:glycosyltransferase 87 family protein [Allocatelliglobosispora scoriae]MBB5870973.1 hypothetical protein [Allocatelliglobosispora scoriae]
MWQRFAPGWLADLALYSSSALFALLTWHLSTLTPHRHWGSVAFWGYLGAAVVAAAAIVFRRGSLRLRAALLGVTVASTMLLPLVIEAVQRATGRSGRAQEEVPVIEAAGRRLLELGTPYLDRDTIAGLPESLRLLAYLPYQPAMALLGVPRALRPADWWADARVMFLLVGAGAIATALMALRLAPVHPRALLALQSVTVLPLCALTLATGGDDVPVLTLCLLALALSATGHVGASGVIIGIAGCLKLIALPVAVVIGALILARRRRDIAPFLIAALGMPLLVLVPSLLLNVDSVVENVLRFPLGHALVTSPAGSPLPGHLIATQLTGGRQVAIGLLIAAMIAFGVLLLRRPPRTAAQAAVVSGVALLVAILLLPATRFGYLMYPVALLAWAPALRWGERT